MMIVPGWAKGRDLLYIYLEVEPSVISRSKETKLKLAYVCPGSHITRTMTHRGKTDAMFNYLNKVLFSYINDPWVSKKNYKVANIGSLSVAQLP
jgi:hypothetical protein